MATAQDAPTANYVRLIEDAIHLLDKVAQLSEITCEQLDHHLHEPWAEILAPHHRTLFYDANSLVFRLSSFLHLPINSDFAQLPLIEDQSCVDCLPSPRY